MSDSQGSPSEGHVLDTPSRVVAEFKRHDSEGTGTIDKRSLGLLLGTLLPNYTSKEVDLFLDGYSSHVDYEAFIQLLFDPHLGHKHRGVSVHHLATGLLQQVQAVGLGQDARVYDIEPVIIRPKGQGVRCPRDGRMGAAYVDSIYGADQAGVAQFMLSYTWGYRVSDIADTLQSFCELKGLDTKRTYIWICCLCVNQHRVQEARERGDVVPFEAFEQQFGERVAGIGKVIAMMSPWRCPAYLTRVWCDYELFKALDCDADVEICMPPKETHDLLRSLHEGSGVDEMWSALADVQVEQAQSSVATDKERILELIKLGPGFRTLNTAVAVKLQAWIASVAQAYCFERLEAQPEAAAGDVILCTVVGNLLRQVGRLDDAAEVLSRGRERATRAGALETPNGAELLRNAGTVRRDTGDVDGAFADFETARQILQRLGRLESDAGALVLQSMGIGERCRGDLGKALEYFEMAKSIREQTGTLHDREGALLYLSQGISRRQAGDAEAAVADLRRAKLLLEQEGALRTPDGVEVLRNLGIARRDSGDVGSALEDLFAARDVLRSLGMLETCEAARLLHSIGICFFRRGELDAALEWYLQALSVRERSRTLETLDGAQLRTVMGKLRRQQGDVHGALEEFEAARATYRGLGALESPPARELCREMDALRG